jgi:hypothetical protein
MRTACRNRRQFSWAVAFLVLASVGQAQVNVGRISGTVTDSTGAALPGVTVTVTHDETRFRQTTVSDGSGAYVATHLPIGRYTVVAELQGFKKVSKTANDLAADGRLTVNFSMALGDVTETIEVVAELGETVNTVSGELARVVDSEQVQNLALNGRNYLELTTLIPGTPVLNEDSINSMVGLGINTSINGGRGNTTSLNIDGQYNMVAGSNNSQISNIGVDFIDQVTIKTSNFSAEYGRQSGANVNVTTRSGGNKFHGGASAFRRNEAWDANNWFLNRAELEAPDLDYDNFGWHLGGPVKRDKLFFFIGQEWKQVRRSSTAQRRTLPTTAELNGDFSARRVNNQPVFLRDPLKSGVCSATDRTACFTDPQRIPANRITADGRAIANLFARMQQEARDFTDTPTANNALFQRPNDFDNRQEIARLDWNVSEKHRLYGRALLETNEIIDPFGTFINSQLPTTPNLRNRPGRNIQIGHIWNVSPSVINEFKAGSAWNSQRMFADGDIWRRDTYGFQFPQIFMNGSRFEEATPRIEVNGFATAESMTRSLISPTTDISISNTLSVTKGSHSFKVGGIYIRDRVDQNGRTNHAGDVRFNTGGNPNTSSHSFADALLGNFRTYIEAEVDPVGFFRFSQVDGFVTDNWRVSRTLSVELGLRYQWHGPIYTQANNLTAFVESAYDPAQAVRVASNGTIVANSGNRYNGLVRVGDGVPTEELSRVPFGDSQRVLSVPTGAPRGHYKSQSDLMPRVSFAWSPLGEKLAFRGGVGIFYDRPEGNIVFSTLNSPPYNESVQRDNANLANPLAGTTPAGQPWATIEAIDPGFSPPKTTNWSFSVQRELPLGMFGEVAYVGSAGRNLTRTPDINRLTPEQIRARAALPTAQQPNVNSLRRYQGFGSINMHYSDAYSDYHALQVYLAKRRGNLNYTVSYTLGSSKSVGNARGDDGVDSIDEDLFDLSGNYGPASNDRRHILVLTYQYSFPFFAKSGGVLKTLFGGWEISGITNYQTGAPETPDASVEPFGTRRADYLGGPVQPENPGFDSWLNRDAFAPAPQDRKGNAPLGILRLPGFKRSNVALRKRTTLAKDVRLTFQLDAFNVFNQVNFRTLNTRVDQDNFGTFSTAAPPRELQVGVRLDF